MSTPTAKSHLPSHPNELTPVGMQSMVPTTIITGQPNSLLTQKYPWHPKNIYVSGQEGKKNK
jgi:hypothetical protein